MARQTHFILCGESDKISESEGPANRVGMTAVKCQVRPCKGQCLHE